MNTIITRTEQETLSAGKEFAKKLQPGDVVACYGELGSGKTRFIKGICQHFGVSEHVTSPTFTIINEYHAKKMMLYHFDFYRIRSLAEIEELGFEEYLYDEGICLIEWAEKATDVLPAKRYDVHFQFGHDENTREIRITEPIEVTA
jgi:tRNA threonylcarbamoyladenosine biosynthesis protein TsaE